MRARLQWCELKMQVKKTSSLILCAGPMRWPVDGEQLSSRASQARVSENLDLRDPAQRGTTPDADAGEEARGEEERYAVAQFMSHEPLEPFRSGRIMSSRWRSCRRQSFPARCTSEGCDARPDVRRKKYWRGSSLGRCGRKIDRRPRRKSVVNTTRARIPKLPHRAEVTQRPFSYQGTRCNCTPESRRRADHAVAPSRMAKIRCCPSTSCQRSLPTGFHLMVCPRRSLDAVNGKHAVFVYIGSGSD